MNILIAMPWDQERGGVTHVAASLGRELESRGHRTTFLFPGNEWRLRHSRSRRGFTAVFARLRDFAGPDDSLRARLSWQSCALTTLPQLVRLCRRMQIDLINVHYPDSGLSILVDVVRHLSIPLVVSAHGSDLLPDDRASIDRGTTRLLRAANAVIVPSETYRSAVAAAFPECRDRLTYVYNGYDESEICRSVETMEHASPLCAVCIANHVPKKGIDVLLQALAHLPRGLIRVRLIGEGPLRVALESQARSLGLTDDVTFLGSIGRSAIFREIQRSDFLVMPSRHASESFGLAALEAMACGKAVVASDIGGLRELIDHETTGLLVPPDDPSALAQGMLRLCGDRELRDRLGTAARTKAQQFTTRATADRYEFLFRTVAPTQPG